MKPFRCITSCGFSTEHKTKKNALSQHLQTTAFVLFGLFAFTFACMDWAGCVVVVVVVFSVYLYCTVHISFFFAIFDIYNMIN